MRRRNFLLSGGLATIGLSAPMLQAAASSSTQHADLSVFSAFQNKAVNKHFSAFSKDLESHLSEISESSVQTKAYLKPVKVVHFRQKGSDYVLVYKNASSTYFEFKKSGKKETTTISDRWQKSWNII